MSLKNAKGIILDTSDLNVLIRFPKPKKTHWPNLLFQSWNWSAQQKSAVNGFTGRLWPPRARALACLTTASLDMDPAHASVCSSLHTPLTCSSPLPPPPPGPETYPSHPTAPCIASRWHKGPLGTPLAGSPAGSLGRWPGQYTLNACAANSESFSNCQWSNTHTRQACNLVFEAPKHVKHIMAVPLLSLVYYMHMLRVYA